MSHPSNNILQVLSTWHAVIVSASIVKVLDQQRLLLFASKHFFTVAKAAV